MDELAGLGRFEEGAALAEELGLSAKAARLWEQACRFDEAARAFLRSGRPDRALLAAVRTQEIELRERCIAELAAAPELARGASARLEALALPKVAAELQQRLGNLEGAAELYRCAGDWFLAAKLSARLGRPDAAVDDLRRCIELDHDTNLARSALGLLLERRGRLVEALALLQKVPDSDRLARHALLTSARLLSKLELPVAAHEVLERAGPLPAGAPAPELSEFESGAAEYRGSERDEDVLFGRYTILETVASSATARVYKAEDRVLGREVAIKLFAPSLMTGTGRDAFYRFEREVSVLRELDHPAVVPLYAYHPEGPALVLAWMKGGSLSARLAQGPLSPQFAALVACRVLLALGEAHRRGILHRDIKPDNILLDEHGVPHLADFGTAHVADHAETVTHGVLGTLAYMAPAQRQGHPANVGSDVYSVGAVFWHLLTGGPPEHALPFGCPELSEDQRRLACRLVDPEKLPTSCREALALIQAERWPTTAVWVRAPSPSPPPSSARSGQRLQGSLPDAFDRVLDRPVSVLDATPELLARARTFVAADHPNLASVLAYDPETERVWVESLDATNERVLELHERRLLTSAIERLHAAGGCHGSVDADHIGWRGSEPALRFPAHTRVATLAEDLARLAAIR